MYSINGNELQKHLVTSYNSLGQKVKQVKYLNGEKDFSNVETFYYSSNGALSSIVDSSNRGYVEVTTFNYNDNNILEFSITKKDSDTTEFRTYPNQNTIIRRSYYGMTCRFDTTILEKPNVELEYFGSEASRAVQYSHLDSILYDLNDPRIIKRDIKWHYIYKNEFDTRGNLIKAKARVEKSHISLVTYAYNEKGLLINKIERYLIRKKTIVYIPHYFIYE